MSKLPAQFSRILIIKLRHHGDVLLVTPVINTLKDNYPSVEIDVLLYKETEPILANFSSVANIFSMDRQWRKQGVRAHFSHEWRLLKQLRRRKYDIVINLADQWYSAFVTRFTRAKVRIGFDLAKRRSLFWTKCFTNLVPTEHSEFLHIVEQNLSTLSLLNLPSTSTKVTMSYRQEDRDTVRVLLEQHGVSQKYIVVQPTSRWFFKCWDEKKMSGTISALQSDGWTVVVTSGPDRKEEDMVETILSSCPKESVISFAGLLTLPQLAALIDEANLFIGVDSISMHMAAALKTPCIALFGPSKLVFWRPWEAKGEVIWAGDYGDLPDPDDVDTKTGIRYLNVIPSDVVIAAARRNLL
ncbi:putative lipopolysaccharide heptosyltransferase III [Photorhabdus khanii]|uniref:Putative lipopolysaccharide heptosyltransferase III n=1 Tax=Photorhabdus khanii subsp. guanajuatensis TaxID=2100166 RepID=A0A4R4K0G4_9GAMM|nr:putative lipopolysaccharide heptosyltransferase III [Photorhabdus khanii]TDB60678.1 putative lipopolysaccharide heptosyltransferase III [Photorhabdus khanii subsp. guanajuatensis]